MLRVAVLYDDMAARAEREARYATTLGRSARSYHQQQKGHEGDGKR
jgi:hypothetical protein